MDDKGREDGDEDERLDVDEFVRREVDDWDDEAKSRARFKALSGQRSDWEPLYLFWRDLIIKVARHRRTFIVRPSRVNRLWFRRAGLSPLSLGRVLLEMNRAGDLLPHTSDPTPPVLLPLPSLFRRALRYSTGAEAEKTAGDHHDGIDLPEGRYIIKLLAEERSNQVISELSENHWTSSCVVTMANFRKVCLGSDEEALVILKHLSEKGTARRLIINNPRDHLPIEGVKICLTPGGTVSSPSSIDYSTLQLISTAENLEQQLSLIDQRYSKSRTSALASIENGNKVTALKYVKEMKLQSLSRERCTSLLNRVENSLQVLTDAESSKKVLEAITSSTHAIRDTQVSIEEVESCLSEVDESIDTLKLFDDLLGANTSSSSIPDEEIEDEFNRMRLEIAENVPTKTVVGDSLVDALSNLSIRDGEVKRLVGEERSANKAMSEKAVFEAA